MFEPSFPIETARMLLRPCQPDDATALLDLYGREDVCRYLLWSPIDVDGARELVESRMKQTRIESDGDAVRLIAVESSTGRTIGEFMLRVTNIAGRQAEIGWGIHPDVQRRGLATEGARALLALAFEGFDLHRVVASTDPRNAASLKVMARLGMRPEAHFVDILFVKGQWVSQVVCAILRAEWERTGRS